MYDILFLSFTFKLLQMSKRISYKNAVSRPAITAKPSTPSPSPSPFYTLTESLAFASDPNIKIVYLTEKGIDLIEAVPEFAQIHYATRYGYMWDYLIHNPYKFINNDKQIRIVKTTEAELASLLPAPTPVSPVLASEPEPIPEPEPVLEETELLTIIESMPHDERSFDKIVDIVANYMCKNGFDSTLIDTICQTVVNKGLVLETSIPPGIINIESEIDADADADSEKTILCEHEHYYEHGHEESSLTESSLTGWLVTSFGSVCGSVCTSIQKITLAILPIPTDTEWIMLD